MTGQWNMLRALAWKEWREQRSVALAGIGLAILIPVILMAATAASPRPLDLASIAALLPAIYLAVLWPLFAAAAGAGTIATEIGEGTLGFLLSRPASRARIWSVKVVMAFLSGLMMLAGSLLVALLVGRLAGTPVLTLRAGELPERLGFDLAQGYGLGILASSLTLALLLFATSVFFSTFLPRAMTAAGAGVAASLLILAALLMLWSRLDLVPRLEPGWMVLEVWIAAGLLLLASLYVFSRGELLRGSGVRRVTAMASLMIVGGLGLLTLPMVQVHGRLTPSTAEYLNLTPTTTGDALVAAVTGKTRMIPQIWLIHSDGTGMERLTGSLTFAPAISPDGKWIAYLSQRGPLGLRSSQVELRAIRADGSDDRRLASPSIQHWMTNHRGQVAFSPDGTRVAALGSGLLVIAPLQGGAPSTIQLPPVSGLKQSSLAGWTADGSEVLLLSRSREKDEDSSVLSGVDSASGRIRPIFQAQANTFMGIPGERAAGWTRVPIVVDGSLLLVDPRSGETETISDKAAYWSPSFSEDGQFLAYAVRHGARGERGESEIRLRDLATGSDNALATLPGGAGGILISPSRDLFIVNRYEEGKTIPSVAVTREGKTQELPSGWSWLGWYGRERILVAESPWGAGRLAVMDVASGHVRPIFP